MTSPEQWANLIGATAIDADGEKIGTVGQVYISNDTDQPEWVTVNTGLFGIRESLAPLYNAQPGQGEVRLAVTKQQIKDAPNPNLDDENADSSEIDELYRYYAGYLAPTHTENADDRDYADASTDYADTGTADDGITPSAERPHLGTERVPAERVRVRKYVVTEYVTQTVPVSHEEIRVEREPITEADRDDAAADPEVSEADYEVILHAERPLTDQGAVPAERVSTETAGEEPPANDQVR